MTYGLFIAIGATTGVLSMQSAVDQTKQEPDVHRDPYSGLITIKYVQDGVERAYRLDPGTRIEPAVQSRVSPTKRGYRYTYELYNGGGAFQPINSFSLHASMPSEIAETPDGWQPNVVPLTNRLSWYKIGGGGVSPGGRQNNFSVDSLLLPAPTSARVRGDAPAAVVPPNVPPAVYSLIARLSARDYLDVWVLTPTIPIADNEPELTPGVLTARIYGRYARALYLSSHPEKSAVIDRLSASIQTFESGNRAAGQRMLDELWKLLESSAVTGWARALNEGLIICLQGIYERFDFQR